MGPCVSGIETKGEKNLYLTFDDGPVPGCTEKVLELLRRYEASATFFVIGERAQRHQALVREIQSGGHSIGNHSLDHDFKNFFTSRKRMREWVVKSEALLRGLGVKSVGFRSPAGVRTPPLQAALRELGLPLIHWKVRFYDTAIAWTEQKALRSLKSTPAGSIVLLHDSHENESATQFLQTLEAYLKRGRELGFRFTAISGL